MNALTGNTSAWNGLIGKRVRDEGHGYLTYNFRGQMTGHLDKMFRIPEDIEELVNKINNSKRIELPNCGHLIPLEEPEQFSDHIINFVNNLN